MKEQSHQANVLTTKVQDNDITREIQKTFTLDVDEITFTKHPKIEGEYNIGYITGSSGSGKSLMLNEYNTVEPLEYDDRPICSYFKDYKEAEEMLLGVGLCSIPVWLLPYDVLSTGQKYRVDTARRLKDGAIFDEFTSVIDRNTAKGLARSMGNLIRKKGLKNITIAGPHLDIIPYLQPCWVYNTDTRTTTENPKSTSEVILSVEV